MEVSIHLRPPVPGDVAARDAHPPELGAAPAVLRAPESAPSRCPTSVSAPPRTLVMPRRSTAAASVVPRASPRGQHRQGTEPGRERLRPPAAAGLRAQDLVVVAGLEGTVRVAAVHVMPHRQRRGRVALGPPGGERRWSSGPPPAGPAPPSPPRSGSRPPPQHHVRPRPHHVEIEGPVRVEVQRIGPGPSPSGRAGHRPRSGTPPRSRRAAAALSRPPPRGRAGRHRCSRARPARRPRNVPTPPE